MPNRLSQSIACCLRGAQHQHICSMPDLLQCSVPSDCLVGRQAASLKLDFKHLKHDLQNESEVLPRMRLHLLKTAWQRLPAAAHVGCWKCQQVLAKVPCDAWLLLPGETCRFLIRAPIHGSFCHLTQCNCKTSVCHANTHLPVLKSACCYI